MSKPYATEEQVAVTAVRRACHLTTKVFNEFVRKEKPNKGRSSPVTVGSFASQAVITLILGRAFPEDPIITEDDATDLRRESANDMREGIMDLVNDALALNLSFDERESWGIGPGQQKTMDQILSAIDKGRFQGGSIGRMWTIDPLDGTKGFIRGEQYAISVSLIVDGVPVLGVMGCPNLPIDPALPSSGTGCIFAAVAKWGAVQLTLSIGSPTPLSIPAFTRDSLNLLESSEAAHSSNSTNHRINTLLKVTREPIRMDSQAKYACLARGDGGAYLRIPTGARYQEKIWDHAPGQVLVREAGGRVTDSRGQPLNFGLGRTLGENLGVIAVGKRDHARVLRAVQRALEIRVPVRANSKRSWLR